MPEPILTAVCKEPDGDVERAVYPMMLTVESMKTFWKKSRQFKNLFDHNINGDFKRFVELFLYHDVDGNLQSNGLFWVVDDFVGVFYMTHITPGTNAEVHYTFFDRRHRGRAELTKEMMKYVFRKYNFRRLTVEIPMYASKHTFSFISSLGFVREGRKRKAQWYNDAWFDVMIFGILKEEALNAE